MPKRKLSRELLKRIESVKAKRARTVLDHIVKHGYITTEQLREEYGYDHPPRAPRDVRELGIPLETFKVTASNGRRIAAYRFPKDIDARLVGAAGRRAFPKAFKAELLEAQGNQCAVCGIRLEARLLQIDHRVPYAVLPDSVGTELAAADYQLLCASCNRAKSWSCEHCENNLSLRRPGHCQSCFWSKPMAYEHIAMKDVRRLELTWQSDVQDYDRLKRKAGKQGRTLPDYVKRILRRAIEEE